MGDQADLHVDALRAMGCAVVVLTPKDIQLLNCDENDEPTVSLEQADRWLRNHRKDVEEAILGDYWGDTIQTLFDFLPIEEEDRDGA